MASGSMRMARCTQLGGLPTLGVVSIAGQEDAVAGPDVDRVVLEVGGAGGGVRVLRTDSDDVIPERRAQAAAGLCQGERPGWRERHVRCHAP